MQAELAVLAVLRPRCHSVSHDTRAAEMSPKPEPGWSPRRREGDKVVSPAHRTRGHKNR